MAPIARRRSLRRLDIEVIERVIRECRPAQPYYELYGGEPLLYPAPREEFCGRSGRREARCSLPTNGTLLAQHAELLVETSPDRIWVSLDGPPEINDRQRGHGVFDRAIEGIGRLHAIRQRRGLTYPQIGVSLVVTPLNYRYLQTFFFEALDLSKLDCVSIELQAYLTEQDHGDYEQVLQREFGIATAPVAKGFVNDPAIFADMDFGLLARPDRDDNREVPGRGAVPEHVPQGHERGQHPKVLQRGLVLHVARQETMLVPLDQHGDQRTW